MQNQPLGVNQMARAVQGAQVGVVVPGSGVLLPEREAGRPSAALSQSKAQAVAVDGAPLNLNRWQVPGTTSPPGPQ